MASGLWDWIELLEWVSRLGLEFMRGVGRKVIEGVHLPDGWSYTIEEVSILHREPYFVSTLYLPYRGDVVIRSGIYGTLEQARVGVDELLRHHSSLYQGTK